MTSRHIPIALSLVFAASTACSKEKKLSCVDVAAAAKKWAEVSDEGGGAQLSSSILDSCSNDTWSEPYKRCVVAAFGTADPMEAGAKCEEKKTSGDKNAGAKAKTTEASQFLKKMSDASRTYYSMPAYSSADSLNPSVVAKQFPKSVGPTPPLGTCCSNGGKCSPMDGDWEAQSWLALDFALRDPHYYSYEFVSDEKSFTAFAYGDLDCDGEYSTFSLYGEIVEGEVMSSGDVIKYKPLE